MFRTIKVGFLLFLFSLSVFAGNSVPAETAKRYVLNFKDDAIKEMLTYNIPASITLAQGMLESNFGTSDLALNANNHFGIKCHEEWDGPTYIKTDDEKDECFRKYSNVLDSYTDHSLFLKSRARYAQLFELDHADYKGWAKGLKEAGYATDPKYAQRLLELIETYELFKYDVSQETSKEVKRAVTKKRQAKNIKSEVAKQESPKVKLTEPKPKPVKVEKSERHEILRVGIVKYVIVQPNDSFSKIAKDTDKDLWQLYKFNDLSANDKLIAGERLYLQPKRRKAKEAFHTVEKGETMKSISQLYCIKLKSLYRKNNMKELEEPLPGQILYMRHRRK